MTLVLSFIFGAVFGSFANVLIYRVPKRESLIPASSCPNCETRIKPYQNIPLFSWIFLKGRCATCKEPIPFQYFLVEFLTATLFLLVTLVLPSELVYGGRLEILSLQNLLIVFVFYFLAFVTVVLTFIDFETKLLPNRIVYPSFIVVFIVSLLYSFLNWQESGVANFSPFIGMGILLSLFLMVFLVSRGKGLGFGDVKLSTVLGLALGLLNFWLTFVMFFLTYLFGAIYAIFLLKLSKVDRKSEIAFGPWMMLGFWLTVFWGRLILEFYLGFL